MQYVFHITQKHQWQHAQELGYYSAPSLVTEGFIHLSTASQVALTANRFFQGCTGLVLLSVDPARLQAELRYDTIASGEIFPHLYGALNLDAVVEVLDFAPNQDGVFTSPFL